MRLICIQKLNKLVFIAYRNREQQEWKIEMKRFEDRMDSVKEELKKEREMSQRKTTRDIGEVCCILKHSPD